MTNDQIWNCETAVQNLLDVNLPEWIDPEISAATIAAIVQSGCASGAYMPAVTYYDALNTMAAYGDDVFGYIDDVLGELPAPQGDVSWSGMACHYLSLAVELWANDIMNQLEELDIEEGAEA